MHEVFFMTSIEHFSYIAIFLFAIFCGYIIPIPEEILLLIIGYMSRIGIIHFLPAVFVTIIAFVIGDNILYRLTLNNNKHVTKLVHEVFSLKFVENNKAFFEKHLNTTIFLSRFIPFVRFAGPVFAGYTKAKKGAFFVFNTLAIIIYTPFMVWVGFFFHDSFLQIINNISRIRHISVILLWIIIGLLITRAVDYLFNKTFKQ